MSKAIQTITVNTTINGEARTLEVAPDERLLDALRRHGVYGVKSSCRSGECGACCALMDGEVVTTCLILAGQAEGRELVTAEGLPQLVEGLAKGAWHPLQEEFVKRGAAQCGYCIPGMLVAAAKRLEEGGEIDEAEVRTAISGNLCRCTGYVKPVEAILAAARKMVGENVDIPDEHPATDVVGHSLPKVDGAQLVTGRPAYTDDIAPSEMLVARILGSPHPHARINQIDASRARALPGVHAVLTHEDVPRNPYARAGQDYPEPSPYDFVVLDQKVRHIGDRVAVVAAESDRIAREALDLIRVEYERLDAVFDMEEALEEGAPVIHDEEDTTGIADRQRNLCGEGLIEGGDVDAALDSAHFVHESDWHTGPVQPGHLEPHVTIGWLDEDDRIVLRSSTQVPFHTRRQVAQALGLPINRIRLIKPRIGGGFGGKQELLFEDLVAALVLETRHPVRLILDPDEEWTMARRRHPMRMKIRSGHNEDGSLVALELDSIADAGAYGSHSPTVPYSCGKTNLSRYPADHLRFRFRAAYTNTPISGAMRGYGSIQGNFAMESHMDQVAQQLGLDPVELRKRMAIKEGEIERIRAFADKGNNPEDFKVTSCGLYDCIEQAAEAFDWSGSLERVRQWNADNPVIKRGVGMSIGSKGSGIAKVDKATATIRVNEDGTFLLLVGAVDVGTGADTVLLQIAAEVLQVPVEQFSIKASDTDVTPFDSGAYAASTTTVSGKAVYLTAKDTLAALRRHAARMLGCGDDALQYDHAVFSDGEGNSCTLAEVATEAVCVLGDSLVQTHSFVPTTSPPPYSAQFAEVEVDTETGELRCTRFVSAIDCGVAINPRLAEGQVEGAVTMGLGQALTEETQMDGGRVVNPGLLDYRMLKSTDMPEMTTILVQSHPADGPFGAKSVAEIPIVGVPAAVANAVTNAIGVRLQEIPMTRERILRALGKL